MFEMVVGLSAPIRHFIIRTDNTKTVFCQYVHIVLDESIYFKVLDV